MIAAGNKFDFDDKNSIETSLASAENSLQIGKGAVLDAPGGIQLFCGTAAIDGTVKSGYDAGKIDTTYILAANKLVMTDLDEDGAYRDDLEADTNNHIAIGENASISTPWELSVIGGKIDFKGKAESTGDAVDLIAIKNYNMESKQRPDQNNSDNTFNYRNITMETAAGNDVTVTGGTLQTPADIYMVGSSISVDGAKLTANTGNNGAVGFLAGSKVVTSDAADSMEINGTANNAIDLKNTNILAKDGVVAYGGKLNLANTTMDGGNTSIALAAANHYNDQEGADSAASFTASANNTITLDKATLTTIAEGTDDVNTIGIMAGNVTLNKANLTSGGVTISARSGYKTTKVDEENDPTAIQCAAGDGMNVNIKDSELTANDKDEVIDITGNQVTIDGSSNLKSAGAILVGTGKTVDIDYKAKTVNATGANVKIGKDVKFDSSNKVIKPGTENIEETEPSKPDTPVVTPDPKPAVDIDKNIEKGKTDMAKTIGDNQDQVTAAVKQQVEKLSASDMTDEAKAAQVKGYTEAIDEKAATAEEKQALVKEVVKSFEPTQQASVEAQNKQDEAAENKNAQAVMPNLTVKEQAPAAHEGTAANVTVDGVAVSE